MPNHNGFGFPRSRPARPRGTTSTTHDLFDTRPTPQPRLTAPVPVSPEFRMKLMGRVQDLRAEHRGALPDIMDADKVAKLQAAADTGEAVEVRLSRGGLGSSGASVILKNSADLEASTSFILKTSGGFAGAQYYGPFDL